MRREALENFIVLKQSRDRSQVCDRDFKLFKIAILRILEHFLFDRWLCDFTWKKTYFLFRYKTKLL